MPNTISLISVVRDEESYIRRMIESAVSVVSEIVIVDQMSEDETEYEARKASVDFDIPMIYEKDDKVGYAELSRQKAINLASSEYVLLLDGDEVIVDPLRLLELDGNGYYLSRKTIITLDGIPCIEYVGYDQLRFARRTKCGHLDSIHNTIRVAGSPELLRRAILEEKRVEETLEDMRRYETIEHHDFQVDFIHRLEGFLKNGPPDRPWIPNYWMTMADW